MLIRTIYGTGLLLYKLRNENLYYNTGLGVACYNGNISSITWKAGQDANLRGYRFTYDLQNCLKTSTYGEGIHISQHMNRYNENVTYDKMGNILHLQRFGKLNTSSFGIMDNLSLFYSGNQLRKVTDAISTIATAFNRKYAIYRWSRFGNRIYLRFEWQPDIGFK